MPRIAGTPTGYNHPITGHPIHAPLILVTISVAAVPAIQVPAIVDSGADTTSVPASRLAAIGVNINSLPYLGTTNGVGGQANMWRCDGVITWEGRHICASFVVADKLPVVLLGREDFFKEYTVDFSAWSRNPPIMRIERPTR
jgi:hypothetical protein